MTTINTCACGRATAGAHMCERCARTFSFALANTAAGYLDLDLVAGKHTRFGDTNTGGRVIGKTMPLPVDPRFTDRYKIIELPDGSTETIGKGSKLRLDVETVVASWANRVAREHPPTEGATCAEHCLHTSCADTRTRALPEHRTLTAAIVYLSRHLRWILTHPWCSEMLADFLHLERRINDMTDRPPETWYAGKCSAVVTLDDETFECQRELYARVDKGFMVCTGCGTRHDITGRREVLLREAQDIHVTATEAAQALMSWTDYGGTETKLVDRIRKWRDRDRLEVQSLTSLRGQDRHLYRLGDIQALLIEHAQTQQSKRVGAHP